MGKNTQMTKRTKVHKMKHNIANMPKLKEELLTCVRISMHNCRTQHSTDQL